MKNLMRIKIKTLGPGLHPSQVVVGLETRTGEEALVVDRGHIEGDFIDIGWPVLSPIRRAGMIARSYTIVCQDCSMPWRWRVATAGMRAC